MSAELTVTIPAPLGPMLCEMAARTGTPVEDWIAWAWWVQRGQPRQLGWVQ